MKKLIPVKRRGRPKKNADERINPTPETLAKLEPDHLRILLSKGEITPDQERAGRQIHALFHAMRSGGSPASRLDPPATSKRPVLTKSPVERLSGRQEDLWRKRYIPWARAKGSQVVVRRPRLTNLGLVEQLVSENRSPDLVAARFRVTQFWKLFGSQWTTIMPKNKKKSALHIHMDMT